MKSTVNLVQREGSHGDAEFLRRMLFEAVFWNPETPRPKRDEFMAQPFFDKILADWGRPGDRSFIAEVDGKPVGAAWFRLWKKADDTHGFVAEDIPEFDGFGVVSEYRKKGIGRLLLDTIINRAKADGYRGISVSVDPDNFIRKKYEEAGFFKVGESGTSWTLLLEFTQNSGRNI